MSKRLGIHCDTYALIEWDENGKPSLAATADISDGDADLKAAKEAHPNATQYILRSLHEFESDCTSLCRSYLEQAGWNATFFDDGVHAVVVELNELRRRFNGGERLDLGKNTEGWYSCRPFCGKCSMPREHHGLPTVQCDGYERPRQA